MDLARYACSEPRSLIENFPICNAAHRPATWQGNAYNSVMNITLPELEEAINYWRAARPSTGEERALSPEVNALANWYALMIFNRLATLPYENIDASCLQLIEAWRQQAG